MAKYSFELKKKVVLEYLNDEVGYLYLSRKYGISNKSIIQDWVGAYKVFGDDGIARSKKSKDYTFEFKLHVVELYLSTEVSYQELALSVGLSNRSLVVRWVREFRTAGPDALRPRKKGRVKSLETSNDKDDLIDAPITHIDTSAEHVKQLENEVLKLRIENAFLKELRRLRLEDEARLREQQESSTASEETSN